MLELGPIFRALMRQKVGAVLIALQIALTLSIMVNAIFMMQQRSEQMARPKRPRRSQSVLPEQYRFWRKL